MRKSLQLLWSDVHKDVQFTTILQQRRAENHEVEKLEAQNPGRSSLWVEQNLPALKPVWREECVLHLPLKVTHSVITCPLCDRWSSIHCSTDNNTSITCSHHPDHQLALAVSYKNTFLLWILPPCCYEREEEDSGTCLLHSSASSNSSSALQRRTAGLCGAEITALTQLADVWWGQRSPCIHWMDSRCSTLSQNQNKSLTVFMIYIIICAVVYTPGGGVRRAHAEIDMKLSSM